MVDFSNNNSSSGANNINSLLYKNGAAGGAIQSDFE
jgi:hypothetical protein